MSLYSSNLQLLPRPPRSFLSSGLDETRATLPDFASVAELSHFINRFFNWHVDVPGLYAQSIFGCCFVYLLVIVIGLIMARRIYEGKFWLMRVIRRPSGVIMVPNPMLAFSHMAGLYGIVFAPYIYLASRDFTFQIGPPANVMLWLTLPNFALAYGLVWASMGTYFATPDATMSTLDESRASPLTRFFHHAHFINALSILVPILMTIVIGIPAIVYNSRWEKALQMQREWQVQYSSMPDFTQEMVQQGQLIWFQVLKAAKLGTTVFVLWTVVALTLGIIYLYIALCLIVAVHQDLTRTRLAESSIKTPTADPVVISQIIRDALQANQIRVQEKRSSMLGQPQKSPDQVFPAKQQQQRPIDSAASECQSKKLRKALIHIYIQLFAIVPGAASLGALALTLSCTSHSKLEQPSLDGGNQFEPIMTRIALAFIWIIAFTGGLNFLAIGWKTYEPVFTIKSPHPRPLSNGHIKFKDVAKGLAHIRSTFIDTQTQPAPNDQPNFDASHIAEGDSYDEVMAKVQLWNQGQAQDDTDDSAAEEKKTSPTWDIEAKLHSYSEEKSPPCSTRNFI